MEYVEYRGYNPPQTAKDLKQPMLILQGERDYQVTLKDFELWKTALSSKQNVEFKTYPDLNHWVRERVFRKNTIIQGRFQKL